MPYFPPRSPEPPVTDKDQLEFVRKQRDNWQTFAIVLLVVIFVLAATLVGYMRGIH